ncbi:1-deoxy-D-xylulose-5-phosphate synthase [Streptosporangium sp. NBC_01639]|uniref:1-deoxy-D-xylulose-5-phosphate synthase n=1 Tax=unclassified Streptosporangium TaxID=2632669 RepID=UPI002DD83466|nr:1-deoxy-D-xylulose-5-phosphate synthase [Streptosporangium sp. NBC_01756]WSC87772.1 1-deoxy-D-xylulose-5-phosphate synthase [Streptosporangium sp. NBC_01756]WTD53550.1 1-deoxy-D-xylulose-5-phosphate synthase [Streptosporangium sp. NBC_01639]
MSERTGRPGSLLETVKGPRDLKQLGADELPRLAAEIRDLLVSSTARIGGHLGPNLGVVELTIALHRVFDSPRDRVLWDTGHQAYVHKMLTGRAAQFETLRQEGGLSGYPSQTESEHDIIENSHASTALSYADGLAKAYKLRRESDRTVVAVIGDGALTGGMAWEALNNIAAHRDLPLIIVVNDNGRSYSPTIGGLASHLASLRATQRYEDVLEFVKDNLTKVPLVGPPLYDALHGAKKGIKDVLAPQVMFEDLGLKYIGLVDGHDEQAVETALRKARGFRRPVIVHVLTKKGFGYSFAENHDEDCFHSPGVFDPLTGEEKPKPHGWTNVFSQEIVRLGAERKDIVAITAAMLGPTGLIPFSEAYPDRLYDVGIAEQHALTSAAGLALGGLHPVVAIYATFLNRAFDQLLMDVALHRLPVTVVLDRAGVTGDDGASHNGMWDLSILQVVPGLSVAVPRDEPRLRELLAEAVEVDDGPTVVRYPKGPVATEIEAVGQLGGMDVLRAGDPDVLLVSVGPMAELCLDAAALLDAQGISTTVVDPRWVKPLDEALVTAAGAHKLVVVVEDNGRVGGVGDAVARMLRDADVDVPIRTYGIPQRFLDHAKRAKILSEIGLNAQDIAREITEAVARRSPVLENDPAR